MDQLRKVLKNKAVVEEDVQERVQVDRICDVFVDGDAVTPVNQINWPSMDNDDAWSDLDSSVYSLLTAKQPINIKSVGK